MKYFFYVFVLLIISCSNSNTEKSYQPGIYIGSYRIIGLGEVQNLALISKSSEMRLQMAGGHGFVENIEKVISENTILTVYQDVDSYLFADNFISFTMMKKENTVYDLSGDLMNEDENLNGYYNYSKSDKAEVTESLISDSYNWVIKISSSSGNLYQVTLTTSETGVIDGGDTLGCIFSGKFDPAEGIEGVYPVEIELSMCGDQNGKYQGLTAIDPYQDALVLMASNEFKSVTLYMVR